MDKKLSVLLRCCICVGGSIGMISNCMGIFFSPLSESLAVSVGKISVIVTLNSLLNSFFAPVLVQLNKKIRLSRIMAFGVILAAVNYMLMSITRSLPMLYVCGVLSGIAMCSFSALPASLLLRSWYGEKNGSALGTAMAFSGVFGAIANPILSAIITNMGYTSALRIMALFEIVAVLPCALSLKLKEEVEPVEETAKAETIENNAKTEVKPTSKLETSTLFVLFAAAISFGLMCALNQHFSALAISKGNTLQQSASVMTACMLGNIVFKMAYGTACDRMNPILVTACWGGINAIGTALVLFFGNNPILLRVGGFMFAAAFSLPAVGVSMLTQKVANDQFAQVYSKLTIFANASYAIMVALYGSLFDMTGSYSTPMMITLCGFVLNAVFCSILLKKTKAA